jgi:hypothetical protein
MRVRNTYTYTRDPTQQTATGERESLFGTGHHITGGPGRVQYITPLLPKLIIFVCPFLVHQLNRYIAVNSTTESGPKPG